ncbi:unnamed protein product [Adineta steineri]|uniref:PNPLA domain-containing protein n=1 Tax=Adineta steineri TaxID=433720 RepID=A0A815EJF7_9BILA|nr:unnamed protein product [Adineta steineri]CAF1580910.1 unnamed protein product [Adineta steineri]
MSRHAQYLKKTVSISKLYLDSGSIDNEWDKKLNNALTYYVFFLIINPTLSSSHPLYHHSFNLAKAFITSSDPRTVKIDSSKDSPIHSTEIKESLNKINKYETDRLLYIITECTDETLNIDNLVDNNFTLEFSSSAAVLIAQNRSSELFDLYKVSIGTFGSGMMSSISSLMEDSFHNAMEITEQQRQFKNSFLHLARANFRSKIDDWNGVNVDLELLNNSNIVDNCYYKELKEKSKHMNDINASILNKQQRIEYLLIRSFLCTSIGQFEAAFTALLDANYMININKSVSSQKDKIISDDFTTESKFESLLEKYLSDYFQNLNILIGTCSIKYDEKLLDVTFKCYYDALATVKIKRNIDELQSTELLQILTNLETFLKTLQMSCKQAPFSFNNETLSNYIESVIKYDDSNENNSKSRNSYMQQDNRLPTLNAHTRSLANPSDAIPTLHQRQNEHETNSSSASSIPNLDKNSNVLHHSGPDEIRAPEILPTLDPAPPGYYNILSLDGGGIRGIVEAIILMEIERRTGKYIGELFNCFAGTSTGGILACGLAKQRPMKAKDLLSIYIGPRRFKIFKKRLLWLIRHSKYSSNGIGEVLKAQLPSERLSDCGSHDLIIPTEIHKQGPALFINHANSPRKTGLYFYNPHEPDNIFALRHSCNTLLRDVVRCTSAGAPFFPHKTLDINGIAYTFYDGGYRFNRPDYIALKWATTVRQIPKDKIFLLSLGNSNAAPTALPKIRGVLGFIYNAAEINEVVGYNNPADYCRSELRQQYIRISPNIDITVAMDTTDPTTLSLLWQAAWNKITEMDNTNDSFNKLCIQLLTRSNLPPQLVGIHPPPKRVSYYPTRPMREPEAYYNIDALFSVNDFNIHHENIPGLLETLFESHRWPCKDRLQYPRLNTYSNHRSLSLAAGLPSEK